MNKWIRWWGLIAFVGIVGSIALFWLFFADAVIRRAVEKTGSALAGAEVDVAAARLTFSPLGVTLSGIQVTDPKNPSTNSLEIGRVAFTLDGPNLLRRKIVIQELSAEKLLFGVQRKKPGFVLTPEKSSPRDKQPSSFTLPSFAIPDVTKILETETVGSLKIIDDARADVQRTADSWRKRASELPGKSALDAYRTRLDKLKVSGKAGLANIASGAAEAKKIKDDIDRDLDRVRRSKTAVAADLSSARGLVARAEQAPLDDIRRIRDKYSLSPAGLQNLSQALFGATVASWFDRGLFWYNRISPLLSQSSGKKQGAARVTRPLRGRGVDVKFTERAPLPDFLIRSVNASAQPDAGSFGGTIRNITTDQDILGAPLTFKFEGSGMRDLRAIDISGSLDHIDPSAIKDAFAIKAGGYRAGNMVLSSNKDLPFSVQDGLLDIEIAGRRTATGLTARLVATFRSLRLDAGKQESVAGILPSLRSALARVSAFTIFADISGEPGSYDIKLTSDLDRVFKDAVGRIVQEQSAKLEKELRASILARTEGKLKDLKASLGGLNAAGADIDGIESRLNALSQEAVKSAGGKARLPF